MTPGQGGKTHKEYEIHKGLQFFQVMEDVKLPVPGSEIRLRMCPGLESILKQMSMLLLGK